jgi:hypothetical protein
MGLRPTKSEEDAENQQHRSLTLAARNEGTRYRAATVRESVPLGLASSTERYHDSMVRAGCPTLPCGRGSAWPPPR